MHSELGAAEAEAVCALNDLLIKRQSRVMHYSSWADSWAVYSKWCIAMQFAVGYSCWYRIASYMHRLRCLVARLGWVGPLPAAARCGRGALCRPATFRPPPLASPFPRFPRSRRGPPDVTEASRTRVGCPPAAGFALSLARRSARLGSAFGVRSRGRSNRCCSSARCRDANDLSLDFSGLVTGYTRRRYLPSAVRWILPRQQCSDPHPILGADIWDTCVFVFETCCCCVQQCRRRYEVNNEV